MKNYIRAIEIDDKYVSAYLSAAFIYFKKMDLKNAYVFFKKASSFNHMRAYFWVAICYHYGKGVNQDIEKAKVYYQKGAKLGHLMSERALIWLVFKNGSILEKIFNIPKYISFILKVIMVAHINKNDERLSDRF